jgi:hypothetical protein
MTKQPPPADPFGRELPDLVIASLAIDLTAYEVDQVRRLVLYSDRSTVELLASLIRKAIKQAADGAVSGTLWSPE